MISPVVIEKFSELTKGLGHTWCGLGDFMIRCSTCQMIVVHHNEFYGKDRFVVDSTIDYNLRSKQFTGRLIREEIGKCKPPKL